MKATLGDSTNQHYSRRILTKINQEILRTKEIPELICNPKVIEQKTIANLKLKPEQQSGQSRINAILVGFGIRNKPKTADWNKKQENSNGDPGILNPTEKITTQGKENAELPVNSQIEANKLLIAESKFDQAEDKEPEMERMENERLLRIKRIRDFIKVPKFFGRRTLERLKLEQKPENPRFWKRAISGVRHFGANVYGRLAGVRVDQDLKDSAKVGAATGTATVGGTWAFMGGLHAVGFGSGGIIGGSTAAAIQSSIGNVAAGSLFANMTSIGMVGLDPTGIALAATAIGATGYYSYRYIKGRRAVGEQPKNPPA